MNKKDSSYSKGYILGFNEGYEQAINNIASRIKEDFGKFQQIEWILDEIKKKG